MARRKNDAAKQEERARILRAASELLCEEGPEGLSNRRIAAAAGCTTMTIYTRFGSKGGVLDALFEEGVQQLLKGQEEVSHRDDPMEELLALVQMYRETALAYAGHYQVMFGVGVPGYQPDEENVQRLLGSFERLTETVSRLVPEESARAVAFELFGLCHGLVLTELSGGMSDLVALEPLYLDGARRLVMAKSEALPFDGPRRES